MPAKERKSEVIEALAARAMESLDADRGRPVAGYIRCLLGDVAVEDLTALSQDDLYGAALEMWQLVERRAAAAPEVRVCNPTLERNGWRCSHTVIEIVNDDMPFLLDSIVAELQRRDIGIHLLVHPIVRVERDGEGRLVAVTPHSAGDGAAESHMQLQVQELPEEEHAGVRDALLRVLADVRVAVDDWEPMRSRCAELLAGLESPPRGIAPEAAAEARAVLEWMIEGHFTFLGCRSASLVRDADHPAEVRLQIDGESGLGLLRDSSVTAFDELRTGELKPRAREYLMRPELIHVAQTSMRSTVHRAVHMEAVMVNRLDEAGEVVGNELFAGLFTSEAYSESPRSIPLLRRKVAAVLERSGFAPGSHDARRLQHILDSYPRMELFQTDEEELFELTMGILQLQERKRTALFVRMDPFDRFASCLAYLPRDRYDTELRKKLESILSEAYGGTIDRFYTQLTDSPLARLHFVVDRAHGAPAPPETAAVAEQIAEASRSWADRLASDLVERHGEARGTVLARRYAESFSAAYTSNYSPQAAVTDIDCLESVTAGDELAMNLYRPLERPAEQVGLKVYLTGQRARLSDLVPILENMGVKVIAERPHRVRTAGYEGDLWVRDLLLASADGKQIDIASVRQRFHSLFEGVWLGKLEDDAFNALVLKAEFTPREVGVILAYSKYLRQARIPFSQSSMRKVMGDHPRTARRLIDLFLTRFDPDGGEQADAGAAAIEAEIVNALEKVENLDEDRILRRFLNAILSTVRTNYFQTGEDGGPKPYLAMKIDSARIDELPAPRPYREIHVHCPRMEAIHLRGGPVARGGIRWSDRREDFRTEILGLMKAQMVKNSVIVPVGSKGGFVVRRPPREGGREELLAEVRACYRMMIRGLLDLTDNLDGDRVVPPPRVRRLDGDDPYLVVAADKGTATFSDIANEISESYGFWLGDAFASGGSAGYDHKAMAITARGAWESVKRHFRELRKNIQEEEFTVAGVGDMSGDVFGNGMLLSRGIRLVAAFNHLHVFVDPDPDPEAGWEERKRLFELPRSSWADYDAQRISAGGGVFERKAKWIETTPEMRRLLGLEEERVPPNQLIRAILRCPVDLLWLGGIGTYVKASSESHADADDRANDALRVDAPEVRAAVIGEGANLGLTQRGRVEYTLAGGRLNTDSIDNSAGVDCSDHEVNIKILLGGVESAGDMTRKQRDELLREMTDEVAELVLRDNYLQSQAITVTHYLGAHLLDRVARFMRVLERKGRLSRALERLPDDETLAERLQQGIGFARPELAMLLSHAKIDLAAELLETDFPDDPSTLRDLQLYFPEALRERYGEAIRGHRLRREIVATAVTNEIINRAGIAFVHEVQERTGRSAAEIARAYVVSREVFGVHPLWAEIESLDNRVPAAQQAAMIIECGRLIERSAVWFLHGGAGIERMEETIRDYGAGVGQIAAALHELIAEADRTALQERTRAMVEEGVAEELAGKVAGLQLLSPACDVVQIARASGSEVMSAASTYFAAGSRFGFNWLRRAAKRLPTDTAWDKLAVNAIVDDLFTHQAELTRRVIDDPEAPEEARLAAFIESRRPLVARTDQLVGELQSVANPTLAMLAVANRQLKAVSA